jgi:hypothetical protein
VPFLLRRVRFRAAGILVRQNQLDALLYVGEVFGG